MSAEPAPPVNPRPKNLTHLVLLMCGQLGLLVLASGFELLVAIVAARVRGFGDVTTELAATLLFTGLAAWFGYWVPGLWRGERRAFRMTGFVFIVEAVLFAGMLIGGDIEASCVGAAMIGAAIAAAFAGRLYLMPDVAAHIDYNGAN